MRMREDVDIQARDRERKRKKQAAAGRAGGLKRNGSLVYQQSWRLLRQRVYGVTS